MRARPRRPRPGEDRHDEYDTVPLPLTVCTYARAVAQVSGASASSSSALPQAFGLQKTESRAWMNPQQPYCTTSPPKTDPERATHVQLGEQLFAEAVRLKAQGRHASLAPALSLPLPSAQVSVGSQHTRVHLHREAVQRLRNLPVPPVSTCVGLTFHSHHRPKPRLRWPSTAASHPDRRVRELFGPGSGAVAV
jgi:hypothetical protein